MNEDLWGYRPETGYQTGMDLTGFKVEALDGHIGKIDKESEHAGGTFVVVDTGILIFGKHVLMPAGLISSIDLRDKRVYVQASKSQIESAPEYDKEKHYGNADYLRQVGEHYGRRAM
ncbi:PRC-barrel domain containing protein [Yinghuangia seranimata]|uniref:PRC-barrel domain containing protein n=1 Tax=Yinghuangia seranimata TaxID=408067 RepID=UPI00248B277E|nr:PRC-barrel domain containing protein [Yinghuangia seranimata]MDI2129668.1 PRC-barrel domain containing protein [Yinghuangia seranimata]